MYDVRIRAHIFVRREEDLQQLCFTPATRWTLNACWAVRVGIDMFSSSEGSGAMSASAEMPRYALHMQIHTLRVSVFADPFATSR